MDTTHSGDARIAALSPYECWQLFEEGLAVGVARVVWSGPDGPAIVPVNYTVADGAVWFQTSPDSRLARECRDQRVLVEVDHADPQTHGGWSAVAAGVATIIEPADVPDILGDLRVWPRGPHHIAVRVEPDELSGRRLLPRH
jgi:hypothetical protein